jgi:hypothetical protein
LNATPSSRTQNKGTGTEADIAMLQRLAELGMQLAELAAARALVEAQPENQASEPGRRPRTDPSLLFTRLARTVRDTIAQKVSLTPRTTPAESPAAAKTRKDPRRPFIAAEFDRAVATSDYPKIDRPALRREIDDRLTEALAADPDCLVAGGEFVMTICKEFGLDFDIAQFADEVLVPPGHRLPGVGPIIKHDDLSAISKAAIPPELRNGGTAKKDVWR